MKNTSPILCKHLPICGHDAFLPGYYENRHGEPWIVMFNRATREARLRGGDVDWASAHPVRDGRVDGLIPAPEEAAWLQYDGHMATTFRTPSGRGAGPSRGRS